MSPRDDLGSRTRSPQGLARPLVKPIILNSGEPVGTIACTIRELVQKPFREETFYEKKPLQAFTFSKPCSRDHGCPSNTYPSFLEKKLLVRTSKKWGAVARPPVLTPLPSQANHNSPLIAVGTRRVRLPRNSHTCFGSLDRVSIRS